MCKNRENGQMKKIVIILFATFFVIPMMAQTVQYTAFVYTNDQLAHEIQVYNSEVKTNNSRGLGSSLLKASIDASKGIASGYVTSVVDLGVKAIADLITRKERIQQEWEQTVMAENVFVTQIHTVSGLTDFYSATSSSSPMDPTGMKFDGIGVIRKEGDDTVFYISMHIDRSKIKRIVEHSKFELVLDTLIISPTRSNLPNSSFDTTFRWEDRRDYTMDLSLTITSSWMNELTQIFDNQKLGQFNITIPLTEKDVDSNGFLHYIRRGNEEPKYKVVGSSFVVPRSYSGYIDSKGNAFPIWGTGEYQIAIDIKESCSITDQYSKNWKQNRQRRIKKANEGENVFITSWKFITSQQWDDIAKSWVITVLQAPADIISDEIIDNLGIRTDAAVKKTSQE